MCLTGCAAPGQRVPFILHMTGLQCTCYIAAVRPLLLGVAHTGQKQNSGHTGRCDGLGKEQKHLGLSVDAWTLSHLISAVFKKKEFVVSWQRSRLHQQNGRHHPQPEQKKLQNSGVLTGHLRKNVAKKQELIKCG